MEQDATLDQAAAIARLLMIAQGTHALLRAIVAGGVLSVEQRERAQHQIMAWGHASGAYERLRSDGHSAAEVNGSSPAAECAAAAALPPPNQRSKVEGRRSNVEDSSVLARRQRIIDLLRAQGPRTASQIAAELNLGIKSVTAAVGRCPLFARISREHEPALWSLASDR